MLSNTITVNDGTTDHSFDLVSREGMSSVRRETNTSSELGSVFNIKNTVDLSATSQPNRHLVQFQKSEKDATTGELYPVTVHMVVTRHKKASDAFVKEQVALCSNATALAGFMDDVLMGGN